jgi:hypothetical protein
VVAGRLGRDAVPEVRHLVTYLFGDDAGREAVARIDRRIDQLPGLAGLHLVAQASLRWSAERDQRYSVSVG